MLGTGGPDGQAGDAEGDGGAGDAAQVQAVEKLLGVVLGLGLKLGVVLDLTQCFENRLSLIVLAGRIGVVHLNTSFEGLAFLVRASAEGASDLSRRHRREQDVRAVRPRELARSGYDKRLRRS